MWTRLRKKTKVWTRKQNSSMIVQHLYKSGTAAVPCLLTTSQPRCPRAKTSSKILFKFYSEPESSDGHGVIVGLSSSHLRLPRAPSVAAASRRFSLCRLPGHRRRPETFCSSSCLLVVVVVFSSCCRFSARRRG